MTTIFVYGTLKRGFCRNEILREQLLLGTAITQPLYKLVNCGDYPGMICVKGSDDTHLARSIRGELYEVDAQCLLKLDLVEDVDGGLYRFAPVQIESFMPHLENRSSEIGVPIFTYFYGQDSTSFPDCGIEWTKK